MIFLDKKGNTIKLGSKVSWGSHKSTSKGTVIAIGHGGQTDRFLVKFKGWTGGHNATDQELVIGNRRDVGFTNSCWWFTVDNCNYELTLTQHSAILIGGFLWE